jgi:pyridoxine kinase
MTTIVSIQSQVAGATVGNSVAVFAMQRLGARVIALPTTQFGRRPDKGLPGGGPIPAEVLQSLIDAVEAEHGFAGIDAVLTGYFSSPEQVAVASDAIAKIKAANPRALVVCDPVLGDEPRGLYVRAETAAAIGARLAPLADLITPNRFELEVLSGGARLQDLNAVYAAAMRWPKPVMVTSVHGESDAKDGVLYTAPTGAWLIETPRLPHPAKGAGDLFAALFTARRVLGQSLVVALEAAVGAVHDVIVRTLVEGGDSLAVVEAQDKLDHPESWPTARQFRTF